MGQPSAFQYRSSIPFDRNRVGAAAVYCSDGRFGEQMDDLLHHAMELPRYDRLAIPGGAACLAGHFYTYREEEAVLEQLKFLLDVHKIGRVVLLAHEGCAYYTERLHISPMALERQQREDLAKAVRRVQGLRMNAEIVPIFARLVGDHVSFERVNV